MEKTHITQYCIRGNSRMTNQKEIISGPYDTRAKALETMAYMAKYYRNTHTYARVAKMK